MSEFHPNEPNHGGKDNMGYASAPPPDYYGTADQPRPVMQQPGEMPEYHHQYHPHHQPQPQLMSPPQQQPPPPPQNIVVQGAGPQTNTVNNVITIGNQYEKPTHPPPQNIRGWSTGLCGCFDDCGSCCYALWCMPCFMCSLAASMREHPCGPRCFGTLHVVAMRTKLRTLYGIQGSVCKDICTLIHCNFCAVTQMYRELQNVGEIPQ